MRPYDLIAFDIDGTLVRSPDGATVWELLNRKFIGDSGLNRKRYAAFRAGEISYPEWVALDIGGWRDAGARRAAMIAGFAPLRLAEGAAEALDALRAAGYRLFAVSGTLDLMLVSLWPDHPFEEVYANHVGFDDEGRISHWRATPFDMQGKAQALRAVALREGVPLSRCAFVGDSVNDVWIARDAGFSVALNPRSDELAAACDVVIHSDDVRALLPHFPPAAPEPA